MTATLEPAADVTGDVPRTLDPGLPAQDRRFRGIVRIVSLFVLVMTAAIGLFLGCQSIPTLSRYGLGFFTESQFDPETDTVGIAAVALGTIEVALVALAIAFPLGLMVALFVSEYSPARLRATFVSMLDLMAAIPSILFGLWAFFVIEPHAADLARWLSTYFGWIPIFASDTDTGAASVSMTDFYASAFIAGIAVSVMIIPLAASVMVGVFRQAPLGEREGAFALGSTRWGMVRAVVIPFGRGGIIGSTMLGLGRALGETVAVLLIISPAFDLKLRILTVGTNTFSALIAGRFGEATASQLSALLTAGFVLFLITLAVNTVAAAFVSRSRSGAATEI